MLVKAVFYDRKNSLVGNLQHFFSVCTLLFSYPAGTTRALVSDLLDSWTVRPLLAGVKVVWKLQTLNILKPEEHSTDSEAQLIKQIKSV